MHEPIEKGSNIYAMKGVDLFYTGLDINFPNAFSIKMSREPTKKPLQEVGMKIRGMTEALRIQMSCGELVVYKNFKDIPSHTVMCPCGDPTHYIIKYEESE